MALEPCLITLLDTSPPSPTKENNKSVILAVYCLLDVAHAGEGVRCKLHDGVYIIPAIITSEALNEYQTKRNMRWESLRRSRLVLKKYELKPCVEGVFNPYLLIAEFDSHGYPMKDKTDNLQDLKATDNWKSRCRRAAFQLFDQFQSDDFLNNVDFPKTLTVWDESRAFTETFPGSSRTGNTNNQPSAQHASTTEDDSWQATPMPYINVEHSQNSQESSSQITAAVEESWGETPVSYIKQQDNSECSHNKAQVSLPHGIHDGQGPSHHTSQKLNNQCSVNTTALSLSTSSESEPEISQFPSPEDGIDHISLSPNVKNWVTNNLDSPSLRNLVLKRKNSCTVPPTSLIAGCVLSTANHVDIDNTTKNADASPVKGVISSLCTRDRVRDMDIDNTTNIAAASPINGVISPPCTRDRVCDMDIDSATKNATASPIKGVISSQCTRDRVCKMGIDNATKNAAASPIKGVISSPCTRERGCDAGAGQTSINSESNSKKSSKMTCDTGCKHDPAKKCIGCFLREPIVIPDYLFNQAKKNGFKCQCKT